MHCGAASESSSAKETPARSRSPSPASSTAWIQTRQQLLGFLLRHSLVSPYGHWTKMHRRWLGELIFAHSAQHLAHEEMLQRIERAEALCDRLKRAILELVPQWSLAPVVQAIQALAIFGMFRPTRRACEIARRNWRIVSSPPLRPPCRGGSERAVPHPAFCRHPPGSGPSPAKTHRTRAG